MAGMVERCVGAWEVGDADNSVYFATRAEAEAEAKNGLWDADAFVRRVDGEEFSFALPGGRVVTVEAEDYEEAERDLAAILARDFPGVSMGDVTDA